MHTSFQMEINMSPQPYIFVLSPVGEFTHAPLLCRLKTMYEQVLYYAGILTGYWTLDSGLDRGLDYGLN